MTSSILQLHTSRYVKLAKDDILTKQVRAARVPHLGYLVGRLLVYLLFSFSLSLEVVQSFRPRTHQHATLYACPFRQQQHVNMAPNRSSQRALLLSAALGLVHAVSLPEPTAIPAKVEVRAPIVTPAAVRFDDKYSYVQKRNIIDDIKSDIGGIAKSWGSVLGTDLPSFFTDGKLQVQAAR